MDQGSRNDAPGAVPLPVPPGDGGATGGEGRGTGREPSPAGRRQAGEPAGELFRGVFSTTVQSYVGFGATKRKISQTLYVFAEEQADGTYRVQSLNKHFIPAGRRTTLAREELLAKYLPEPDLYLNKVVPMMRQVHESVEAGDEHRAQAELMSAEFEYKNALRVDEEHIRATFGLGLTYLDRGELDSANLVCRRIITLEAAFSPDHKHLFNEFGIKMRKHGMYGQALRYYFKAYRLSRNDEHLLYNIARTYYEKGKFRLARKFLGLALALRPGFEEAGKLSRAIDRKEAEAPFSDLTLRRDHDA